MRKPEFDTSNVPGDAPPAPARKKPKIGQIIFDCLLCGILAALLLGTCIQRISEKPMPTIFGWGQANVVTCSMEPTIHVGSMILVQKNASYTPGDIVVYVDDSGKLIVHRLLSLDNDTAITKGDANSATDSPIQTSQILGTVKFIIPWAGRILQFIQWPIAVITFVILIGLSCLLFIGKRKSVSV